MRGERERENRNGWLHQFLLYKATPISIPSQGRCLGLAASWLSIQACGPRESILFWNQCPRCSAARNSNSYDSPARNYQLWSTESDGMALNQTP